MSNILNPDNKFFSTINKIIDIIWISLLWSICSFPIFTLFTLITSSLEEDNPEVLAGVVFILVIEMAVKSPFIGPASTAMYYTMVKVVRRERGYATAQFFKCFKANFKVGAPASICFVVFMALMVVDFRYAGSISLSNQTLGTVLYAAFSCITLIALFTLIWIFPILSRFQMGFVQLFRNAMLIAVRHLLSTLIMAAFIAAYIYVAISFVPPQFVIFFPFAIPGASMLVRSFVIEPVFKKYMGEAEGDPEETGIDEWYRE